MNENGSEQVTITGTVTEIIYTNEDNGYTVCEIMSREEGDFVATGYMPYISVGENIEMRGKWTVHRDYGEQFTVYDYKTVLPTDKAAILQYLSSGIIPGIREATAKKIVDAYGEEVFDILLNEPERLGEIKGITKAKAIGFGEEFKKLRSVTEIVVFLQQFNIPAKTAARVHKCFGAEAVEKIKQNPYILCSNIDGITFKTSDNMAHILGLPKNSPERIAAFIRCTLMNAAYTSGHTFLPQELLIEHTTGHLQVTREETENAIFALSVEKDMFCDTVNGISVCYLMSMLTAELYIARRIYSLSQADQKFTMNIKDAERAMNETAAEEGILLAEEQKSAVLAAVTDGCIVITGGPGTGKTTTINTIIKLMKKLKLKVALAAPTGRAAKRLSEVSGIEAKTIHRLLGVVRNDGESAVVFSKNEENTLSADVIIIDEMSMLDVNLMSSLLKAVKPGAKLIMVGDYDQLPSVGPGNVLRDIINSRVIPVIRLDHIFRQAQESMIVVNAHRINKGEMPILKNDSSNFFFMNRDTPVSISSTITDLYANRLPQTYKINPINSIQVLAPSKKGTAGVIALNAELQKKVNPPDYMKNEVARGTTIFRVGDKVMQVKNNYDIDWSRDNGEIGMGIFNGDIGIIEKISSVDKKMDIVFDDDKNVEYDFANLDELELAYAVTVHKSQGNEFPIVIIPVCRYSQFLMYRNLLYTAVTRAKQIVILVGREDCVVHMIKNNKNSQRYSGLLEKLTDIKKLAENESENPFENL